MSSFTLLRALVLGGVLLVVSERPASAYTYESALSVGCHERITATALRTIRGQLATAPRIDADRNDQALIDDLPFTVDADMKDLAAATFLVGVRDNDLHGHAPGELDALAAVHGNPENQKEHCLRAIEDDEPSGSAHALETCRAFIREKIVEALDGLDAQGVPDPNQRVDIDVTLSLRGSVTASLPLFWTRMGQATHTLQDSFTHAFRSPDRMRVRSVLNWIEYVQNDEVESRDGPLHRSGLDECEDLDDLRSLNLGAATQASTELLHAVLDPTLTHDAKLAAVDATLTKYMTYEPGCANDNRWCDAPEQQYAVASSCGCSMIGSRSGAAGALLGSLALALVVARRRHRTRLGALTLAIACFALPARAEAQETTQPVATPSNTTTDPATGAPVAVDPTQPPAGVPTVEESKNEQTEAKHQRFFGVYGAVSGSITNPSLNGQLGVRFRLSQLLTLGLDGELNGWYGVHTKQFRTGVFNIYATGILHYPIRFAQVNLRSTLNLGTSTMLIDLYGAPRGTTGLFFALVPLGLELKLTPALYVVFDALGIAVPVPQLKGAPFAYPQYRTALGLELTF